VDKKGFSLRALRLCEKKLLLSYSEVL